MAVAEFKEMADVGRAEIVIEGDFFNAFAGVEALGDLIGGHTRSLHERDSAHLARENLDEIAA
jgi:hypothetical protein